MSVLDTLLVDAHLGGMYVDDCVVSFCVGGNRTFDFALSTLRKCDGGHNVLYRAALDSFFPTSDMRHVTQAAERCAAALQDMNEVEPSESLRRVLVETTSIAAYREPNEGSKRHRSHSLNGVGTRTPSSRAFGGRYGSSAISLDLDPTTFEEIAFAIRGYSLYSKVLSLSVNCIIRVRAMASKLRLLGTIDDSLKPSRMVHPRCALKHEQRLRTPEPEPVIALTGAAPTSQGEASSQEQHNMIDAHSANALHAASATQCRVLVSADIVNQYVSPVVTAGRHTWRFSILSGETIGVGVAAPSVLRAGVEPYGLQSLAMISSTGILHVNFCRSHISDTMTPFKQGSVVRITADFHTKYIFVEIGRHLREIFRFDVPELAAVVCARNKSLVECVTVSLDDELHRVLALAS